MRKMVLAGLVVSAVVQTAAAQTRLPAVPPDQYDADQKKAAADFLAARKVPVFGPFEPLMHSPEMMTASRQMGDYLRYKSAIGTSLSELVILVTARTWSQSYEWSLHAPIALKQGIAADIIDAIAAGRHPTGMSDDEDICYAFTTEILRNKSVSDATYARAQKRFGDKGVIDITAISGYYALLAMQLNVARFPALQNAPVLKRFPD